MLRVRHPTAVAWLEVGDVDVLVGPVVLEVFEDEAAVAVFGGGFAAEEDCWDGEYLWVEGGFDFAFGD